MRHTIIQLLIVWICLPVLLCVEGNVIFDNTDEKIIIVNPVVSCGNVSAVMNDDDYGISGGGVMGYDVSSNYTKCENDSCVCSSTRKCLCTWFEDALNHVVNNTVIIINGTSIPFRANVQLNEYTNISIIGYDKGVEINCLNRGYIEFKHCKNIIIQNIIWISCGSYFDNWMHDGVGHNFRYNNSFDDSFGNIYFSRLNFSFSTNINLVSCNFESSIVGIYDASCTIHIDQAHFLSTSQFDGYMSLATGLIINRTKSTQESLMVKVTNSHFSQTESIIPSINLLLFYVYINDPGCNLQVLVNQTNISSASYNPGWAAVNGMVWIRLLSFRDANIEFNGVRFLSNTFRANMLEFPLDLLYRFSGVLSVSTGSLQSGLSGRVKIESCLFMNNDANRVVSFEGDIFLDIVNAQFHSNKADSLLFAAFSTRLQRRPLRRLVTTTLTLEQSRFSNNTVGQLILLKNYTNMTTVIVYISELQVINNTLLSGSDGLFLFEDYDSLLAIISHVNYKFNHINGDGSGFHFTSTELVILDPFDPPSMLSPICLPPYFIFNIRQKLAVIVPNFANGLDYCSDLSDDGAPRFQWLLFMNSTFNRNSGGGHGAVFYFNYNINLPTMNMISTCTFSDNNDYTSLIYASSSFARDGFVVKDSRFMRNDETVFYVTNQFLQFSNDTIFDGNRAQNGAAMYLNLDSTAIFTNTSVVSFSNNIARRYGGAIYYDISQSSNACHRNQSALIVKEGASVMFNNNQATAAGNSVYFSISQSCNATVQVDMQSSIFNQSIGEAVMSPSSLRLYYPAQLVNDSDPSTYYVSDIMLGQNIIIPACTIDQNEMPLWSTQFTVQLMNGDNNQNYFLQGSQIISVDCRTLQGINNLVITGSQSFDDTNATITIQLNSFYESGFDWTPITVDLNVQLSSCHSGFYYRNDLEHCVCYTTDNIVTCSDSNSTIRNGYWFGTVNEQPTVTACPINYCNFDNCEATTGTCDLYPLRDNQCRGHRSGVACGNCEEGYTLSFDSTNCISVDRCTAGQTVLVVIVSMLYWIAVIVVVFCMMYFRIDIGYLYGITFYYSIIDILLIEAVQFNADMYQFVTVLSSIAKVLPQFIGQFCFVKGLSGIDQQFIHYIHPLAILLILLALTFIARFSRKLSMFVGRVVIHAICLLLLLSYTSIASTSLLLMRAVRFNNVDELYTYLSPDIEYFHGRHLFYGVVAILTGVLIVIGLPLLLTMEPFVNNKINFVKIKPLLDQFQGCYKDRFRYFAPYYMIFRLIFLIILLINPSNVIVTLYILQLFCSTMMFIHIAVRPYSNSLLNMYDSLMLVTMTLIISLLIIDTYRGFHSNATLALAVILVIMPLLAFVVMTVYLHVEDIKKFAVYCTNAIKSDDDHVENIEMKQSENDVVIVDRHQLHSTKITTVSINPKDNEEEDFTHFRDSLLEMDTT